MKVHKYAKWKTVLNLHNIASAYKYLINASIKDCNLIKQLIIQEQPFKSALEPEKNKILFKAEEVQCIVDWQLMKINKTICGNVTRYWLR